MDIVPVELGERSYRILIGPGLLDDLGRLVAEQVKATTAAVISDQNVAALYGDRAVSWLRRAGFSVELLTVPAGDASKSLAMAERLYDGLAEARIERRSPVVALGGGMVGDLAGFVAATWLRGVPLVQVPTTVEADVDASVGGKTALNHRSGKNLIGAFYQPKLVLIDVDCLRTLEARDARAGLAESLKHAMIADADFLAWQERHLERMLARESAVMTELIRRNCQIKADVVARDERESGLRMILNFGHTVGHAIEAESGYELRHGECVGLGMLAASQIALGRGMISAELVGTVRRLLERLELPLQIPSQIGFEALLERMRQDKKVVGGRIRFVLPTAAGRVTIVDDVSVDQMRQAVETLRS